jgi:phospholipid/cholesterol/gamma-HCH transport system substrate-binding protein
VENTRQASTALSHASSQADVLISDLWSRQLGQKADDTIVSARSAAQNIKAISQQMRQSLAEALGPNEQGVDASTNIRQSLSNLNQA